MPSPGCPAPWPEWGTSWKRPRLPFYLLFLSSLPVFVSGLRVLFSRLSSFFAERGIFAWSASMRLAARSQGYSCGSFCANACEEINTENTAKNSVLMELRKIAAAFQSLQMVNGQRPIAGGIGYKVA